MLVLQGQVDEFNPSAYVMVVAPVCGITPLLEATAIMRKGLITGRREKFSGANLSKDWGLNGGHIVFLTGGKTC
jgi:hypothetical protein